MRQYALRRYTQRRKATEQGSEHVDEGAEEEGIKLELQQLHDVVVSLCHEVEAAKTSIKRLEATFGASAEQQEEPQEHQEKEMKSGSKVRIISRKNEPWKTAQYVGHYATIKSVTPKCVWLIIPGRVDPLRRNKEYVVVVAG